MLVGIKKLLLILLSMIMVLCNVFEEFSSARNTYLSISEGIRCLEFVLKHSRGKMKAERKDEIRTGKLMELMAVGAG